MQGVVWKMNRSITHVVLILIAFMALSQAALAHPRIFSHGNFESAKTEAKKQGKLLVADFTASWCGPCQKMDETTWVDPKVEEWINKYAIAVQVDVDEQPAISEAFSISAMPTVLVFNALDQKEPFDRHTGYLSAANLLKWLTAVERGETVVASLENAVSKASTQHGETEVKARYELATEYLHAGSYDKAAKQYVWLWKYIPEYDPAMGGVRMSFMAGDMEAAAKASKKARKLFESLRDEAEKTDRYDWIVLNNVLGEEQKTLEWFDAAKSDPSQSKDLDTLGPGLEKLLIENNRWSDLGQLIKNPILRVKQAYERAQTIMELTPESNANPFLDDAAEIYCAMLAAGRGDEATKVGNEAIRLEDTAQMRFILFVSAVKAHEPRMEQIAWIVDYYPIKIALIIAAGVSAALGALYVIDRRRQAK
jgi:thioredoxin-like negative regulator of GroEL